MPDGRYTTATTTVPGFNRELGRRVRDNTGEMGCVSGVATRLIEEACVG